MAVERQPLSNLEEFERRNTFLGKLIQKREVQRESISRSEISRPDLRLRLLARAHQRELVGRKIPDSIVRLETRRAELHQQRDVYIQEHADDLIDNARTFEAEVESTRREVERLRKNMRRKQSTQDEVNAVRADLQFLVSLQDTDPSLQVGRTLLSQQRREEEARRQQESVSSAAGRSLLETRAPGIRARVNQYLDAIVDRPELQSPVTGMGMNRIFPALKERVVKDALENRWVSVPFDRDHRPRFDAVSIGICFLLFHPKAAP